MTTKQTHSTAFARFVMSILLIAWTNAFAQPCLMSVEAGNDAPHATEHEHMSHEMHSAGNESTERCSHCVSVGESTSRLCAAGINASCGDPSEAGPDTRKAESKTKLSTQSVAVHAYPGAGSLSHSDPPPAPIDPALLKFESAAPLSVQFCVYLK